MRNRLDLVVLMFIGTCAFTLMSVTPAAADNDPDSSWEAPGLEDAVVVRDGRTGERLTFDQFLEALAQVDAVFLGEAHTDETTHRVQLAVYDGLLARRGDQVVLAMEMFQRDAQTLLDDYVAGRIEEQEFLAGASPWGNYWAAYRPLVERARVGGHRVVGSNFPRSLTRKVGMGGAAALEELTAEERELVPDELFPNTTDYHVRVDNAIRGHLGMMGPANPDDPRLYSTQTLWDNAMGDACATALDARVGNLVLHINGGFHSAYWDGTVRQLQLRRPETTVATVALVPSSNPFLGIVGEIPVADYVVFCEQRASDTESGKHAVHVARDLDYRLHLPEAAKGGEPVPLVIWLSDDGLTAQDGIDLWVDRLGGEAAVLAFEAPYQETQEDLGVGGRWFWPETFAQDVFVMVESVERAWGYTLRHYSIDPARVCLAGEGTGATVVAAITLLTERMDVSAVAIAPRRYAKIKDFPLPLPKWRPSRRPEKHLRVVAREADAQWWREELAEYEEVGLPNDLTISGEEPWSEELAVENGVRVGAGLAEVEAPEGGKRHVLLTGDTPRARHWARLRAARIAAKEGAPVAVLLTEPATDESTPTPVVLAPDDEATRKALPRCPGPFGGTTVLVVPEHATDEEVAAWVALEDDDPIAAASRFHRLSVASRTGERALSVVLATLEAKGRMNVLICPVEFCATGGTMRALRDQTRPFEDRMTLQWQPGLGGGLR